MPSAADDLLSLLPALGNGLSWQTVGAGESGTPVFRRSDGCVYAKLAPPSLAAALRDEKLRNEWAAAQGLPVPAVLAWNESAYGACLATKALPGVAASELTALQLLQAWPSIAAQLRRLHAVPAESCPFARPLSALYQRAVDVVGRGAVNPDFLAVEDLDRPPAQLLARVSAELPLRLAQEQQERVVCHGDACLPNVLVDADTLQCTGLIDLGRLGLADPYVDFSLLLANAGEHWAAPGQAETARALLFDTHGISEPDAGRLGFYLRLDPLTWG